MQGIEPLCQYAVKRKESRRIVPCEEVIHKIEAMLIVKDIEIAQDILIFHIRAAEGHSLVEYRQGIAHRPVCLSGNDMQGLVVYGDALHVGYMPQVLHDIVDSDSVEVVCLAPGEDGRQYLVLLCGGKDEDGMGRRLLQGLQKGIEGRL